MGPIFQQQLFRQRSMLRQGRLRRSKKYPVSACLQPGFAGRTLGVEKTAGIFSAVSGLRPRGLGSFQQNQIPYTTRNEAFEKNTPEQSITRCVRDGRNLAFKGYDALFDSIPFHCIDLRWRPKPSTAGIYLLPTLRGYQGSRDARSRLGLVCPSSPNIVAPEYSAVDR